MPALPLAVLFTIHPALEVTPISKIVATGTRTEPAKGAQIQIQYYGKIQNTLYKINVYSVYQNTFSSKPEFAYEP